MSKLSRLKLVANCVVEVTLIVAVHDVHLHGSRVDALHDAGSKVVNISVLDEGRTRSPRVLAEVRACIIVTILAENGRLSSSCHFRSMPAWTYHMVSVSSAAGLMSFSLSSCCSP